MESRVISILSIDGGFQGITSVMRTVTVTDISIYARLASFTSVNMVNVWKRCKQPLKAAI